MFRLAALCWACMAVAACGSGPAQQSNAEREYQLRGQIIAIAPEESRVTISHDDIENFMSAMTMTFEVRDPSLLDGKQPGDLVAATLVMGDTTAHLSTLTTTGHQPLPEGAATPAPPILREGDLISDASLTDQDGDPLTLTSLRGRRVALTFIYTRCPFPEYCPLMNRNFAAIQKTIRATDSLQDVRLLSVTLDPIYDTPAVLKQQAGVFEADPAIWSWVTPGSMEALHAFGKQFDLFVEGDSAKPADIVHNLRTVVIGPDGRLVKLHTGNDWTVADLLADLSAAAAPAR